MLPSPTSAPDSFTDQFCWPEATARYDFQRQSVQPVDSDLLICWCQRWLDAVPEHVLFTTGHLATVVGVRLSTGREIVVKARPDSPRIRGCTTVQQQLAASGFPAPEVLAGPEKMGD